MKPFIPVLAAVLWIVSVWPGSAAGAEGLHLQDHTGFVTQDTKDHVELLLTALSADKPDYPEVLISAYQSLTQEEWDQVKGRDNRGNLIHLIVVIDDRLARFIIGEQATHYLSTREASRILSDTILPYFSRGQLDLGIRKGSEGIAMTIQSKSL